MTAQRAIAAAAVAVALLPSVASSLGLPVIVPAPGAVPAMPAPADVADDAWAAASPIEPLGPRLATARAAALAAPPTTSSYRVEFACPRTGLPIFGASRDCPMRIVDGADLLGNPGLAVDANPTGRMAWASLHGQQGHEPTNLSRANQTHTTFTSSLFGAGWQDQPYYPPDALSGSSDDRVRVGPIALGIGGGSGGLVIRGEDVHAAMDALGVLYVASLYSLRDAEDANASWAYAIAQWKFDPQLNALDYGEPNAVFRGRADGGAIETLWLVDVAGEETMALAWRERAADGAPFTLGGRNLTAWISVAVTPTDLVSPWTPLGDGAILGSCARTTNPVAYAGLLYVGCVVDAFGDPPVDAPDDAAPGDLLVFALDPAAGTWTFVSEASVRGGDPRLATTPDGRMAIVSVEAVPAADGPADAPANASRRLRAEITTGRAGAEWSAPRAFGDRVHDSSRGLARARVQAIMYRNATDTVHLVILEEATAREVNASESRWRKAFVVLDARGTPLANVDLNLSDRGEVFGGFEGGDAPSGTDVYGDTRDSIIESAGREYLAFADYGVVVFTEILEHDERLAGVALGETPPPPEPVPLAEPIVASVAVGAIASVVAAEAVRRVVAARWGASSGHGRGRR